MNEIPSASGRRVLVTGGAGFIGSHLVESFLAAGDMVTVIDDLSTGSLANIEHLVHHPRFRFALDSITNEMVLDRVVSECDLIVHLAAAVGVDLIVRDPVTVIECNILGARSVLAAARRYRRTVMLASSSEIYGKSTVTPMGEEDDRVLGPTTRSRWCYSTSKAVGEYLALAYHRQVGLPVVVMRFFNTVGPRQSGRYGMVVPRFVDQALAGKPLTIYGDGRQSRCFCDVTDTVRAVVELSRCPEAVGSVFNIGSTEEVTILELARRVLRVVAGVEPPPTVDDLVRDGRIVRVPFESAYESGFEDMVRRVPDLTRIERAIGWQPRVGLDEILRRIAAARRSSLPSSSAGGWQKRPQRED